MQQFCLFLSVKGNVLPYSLPSVRPGADPDVQAVSLQVTLSHPPGARLPLLTARPVPAFPAEVCHRPSASTKLYCLVTETHEREQLAQGCYSTVWQPGLNSRPLSYQSDALATRLSSRRGKSKF